VLNRNLAVIAFSSVIATAAIAGGHGVFVGGFEMVKDNNIVERSRLYLPER